MTAQMKKAVQAVYDLASSVATPEQIKQVADEYEVEVWQLEGYYFDYVAATEEQ